VRVWIASIKSEQPIDILVSESQATRRRIEESTLAQRLGQRVSL
jgi:hypothetical protein